MTLMETKRTRSSFAIYWVLVFILTTHVGVSAASARDTAAVRRRENLALGRPYTMVPQPCYRLCTDPGDRKQLTDGQYTKGYLWGDKMTVGWHYAPPVAITIDLGGDVPIRGVSFNSAARRTGPRQSPAETRDRTSARR